MTGLEPSDVGPRVGGDQPISPADRTLVIDLLSATYTEGRLPEAEYRRRLGLVRTAEVFDDLMPLTRDLPTLSPTPTPTAPRPISPTPSARANQAVRSFQSLGLALPELAASRNRAVLVGIFSGSVRKGVWTAPPEVSGLAIFGGVEIDLRQADWSQPTIEVTILALFGGVDIKVPADVEVVNRAVSIFGGVDVKGTSNRGGQRQLIVQGFCGFGGVVIKAS